MPAAPAHPATNYGNLRSDLATLDPGQVSAFRLRKKVFFWRGDYRPSCKSERLLDGRETRTTNPRPTENRCRRRCRQIDDEWPYTQPAQIRQNPNCGFLQRRDYTKLRQHGETRRGLIVTFYIGANQGSDKFAGARHILAGWGVPQITQTETRAQFVPAGLVR